MLPVHEAILCKILKSFSFMFENTLHAIMEVEAQILSAPFPHGTLNFRYSSIPELLITQ